LDFDAMNAFGSLRLHWPEYLMEASELALYMFVTCALATLLQHPASPAGYLIADGFFRRAFMGLGMGATVVAIVTSPWGKQSGAHFNPGVTLTFYRLGKINFSDAAFYVTAQFLGAVGGVAVVTFVLRGAPGQAAVHYGVTMPGAYGSTIAFVAELTISLILMSTVLFVSNREKIARYTPYFAGALTAMYWAFESPLSGMSTNPARTFGSAFYAGDWHALWIYFTAPPLGMLVAAEIFLRVRGGVGPRCAKLHHSNDKRCIFHCGYRTARPQLLTQKA
jgi:aquaporin Z